MNIYLDKILHFLAGYFIASLFGFIGMYSILVALSAGILKELYDRYIKKTKFDLADLACTVSGGIAWTVIWAILYQ